MTATILVADPVNGVNSKSQFCYGGIHYLIIHYLVLSLYMQKVCFTTLLKNMLQK